MFGVTRFDPSSAPTQSVSPTHATPPTASATGIDALKARVAAKKAQRVEPSTAADSEAAAAPTTTQTAASKPKTKAKERYLKKKSGRRKAAHQKAIHGHTLDDLNAREKERQAKAQETPEQKASRKLAAKEAKRARRAEAARQIDKPADGDSQEERKAIKRALKASKLAHNATDQQQQPAPSTDTTTPNPSKQEPKADSNTLQPAAHTDVAPTEPDPQPRKKRKTEESKAQAAAAGIIHKAAKAAKRSQSAVNSTYAAEQQEEEQRQVERLDALPVFQKPAPLQPPDPSLLANLSVARELADALHVDSRSAVGFDQLVDQCVLNAKLTNRLRTLDIQNFFAGLWIPF